MEERIDLSLLLSPEIVLHIAELCLGVDNATPEVISFASTCKFFREVIITSLAIWKLALVKWFRADVAQAERAEVGIDWYLKAKQMYQLKRRRDFFQFKPFQIERTTFLQKESLCRSGHTTHFISPNRALIIGGCTTGWSTHNDVLEMNFDFENHFVDVKRVLDVPEVDMPWLSWSMLAENNNTVILSTGLPLEFARFDYSGNPTVEKFFNLKGHTAVTILGGAAQVRLWPSGDLLLVGGRMGIAGPIAQIYRIRYDLTKSLVFSSPLLDRTYNKDTPLTYQPRWCPAAVQLDENRVLIFGGWDLSTKFLNDVWILNLRSSTMEQMMCSGELPPPRCQVGSFLINNGRQFVVYGGAFRKEANLGENHTEEAYGDVVRDVEDIYVLDIETGIWVRSPCVGDISSVHTCTSLDDSRVIVIGGMHSDRGAHLPTFHSTVSLLQISPFV